MHTVSKQGMSLLSSVPVLYAYINMHTSYTLTHTHADTDAQAQAQLYTHQNVFIPKHTSICLHPCIYPHTSIHAHILAHTTYTHLCASAKTYTCIQIKNAFIDTTHNAHTHTDTLIR